MKLDLCKMLGVEKEEEFKINNSERIYKIKDNTIYYKYIDEWRISCISFNEIKEIIKLSKEPSYKIIKFIKILDPKWKWISKDKDGLIYLYTVKPYKNESDYMWDIEDTYDEDYYYINDLINDEFDFLSWEDEEPFDITPYK